MKKRLLSQIFSSFWIRIMAMRTLNAQDDASGTLKTILGDAAVVNGQIAGLKFHRGMW